MKYVIIHGSWVSPEKNWFPYLRNQLDLLGQKVIAPKFTVDDWDEITKRGKKAKPKNQKLENWLNTFKKEFLAQVKNEKKLVFIGHSLGSVFILHLIEKFNLKLDCGIFVAPFLEKLNGDWQIDLVNGSFYRSDFDFAKLKKNIPASYVIYSDDDPHVSPKFALDFAEKMGSSIILVKGGRHFNSEAKFLSFPLVFELCKTRIDAKEYI